MSLYNQRGVSAQKEEVHAATAGLDKGLLSPCILQGLSGHPGGRRIGSTDARRWRGVRKAYLAYLYWKETGDFGVWKGIAQDAVVMNLDDLLCVGIVTIPFFFDHRSEQKEYTRRRASAIIHGTQEFFDQLRGLGINIQYLWVAKPQMSAMWSGRSR